MNTTSTIDNNNVSIKILANVLNELSPTVSVSDWLQHIKDCGGDAKKFFAGNGVGYQEYENFIISHDKVKHDALLKKQLKK